MKSRKLWSMSLKYFLSFFPLFVLGFPRDVTQMARFKRQLKRLSQCMQYVGASGAIWEASLPRKNTIKKGEVLFLFPPPRMRRSRRRKRERRIASLSFLSLSPPFFSFSRSSSKPLGTKRRSWGEGEGRKVSQASKGNPGQLGVWNQAGV